MNEEKKTKTEIVIQRKNIKYNEEVYNYIHSNEKDKAYYELVEKNPEETFSCVNTMILSLMEANLFQSTSPSGIGMMKKFYQWN